MKIKQISLLICINDTQKMSQIPPNISIMIPFFYDLPLFQAISLLCIATQSWCPQAFLSLSHGTLHSHSSGMHTMDLIRFHCTGSRLCLWQQIGASLSGFHCRTLTSHSCPVTAGVLLDGRCWDRTVKASPGDILEEVKEAKKISLARSS